MAFKKVAPKQPKRPFKKQSTQNFLGLNKISEEEEMYEVSQKNIIIEASPFKEETPTKSNSNLPEEITF